MVAILFVGCVPIINKEYIDRGYPISKGCSTNLIGYEDGFITNIELTITMSNTYNTNIKIFQCKNDVYWNIVEIGDVFNFERGDWDEYKYTN